MALAFIASFGVAQCSRQRPAPGPVKVMPFGDSITATGCWRVRLWQKLRASGHANFAFVGSQQDPPGSCDNVEHDGHHEGHSGYRASTLANEEARGEGEMDAWFRANPPDILLMHLGTNDVWGAVPTSTTVAALGVAIDTVRKYSPHVVILVAKVIPMAPSGCPACAAGVVSLDAAIGDWAPSESTAESPVVVVDQWTGFDDEADTYDGVHPNATTGAAKIADRWFSALAPRLL